jgi:hypothetical protein
VTQSTAQAIEIALICGFFAGLIIYLARKQKISFRYSAGWLVLCVVGSVAGFFIPAIETLAVKLQIGPGALVAALASFVLLALCIQLSVSISGLQRQLQLLNEDVALQKKLIEDGLAHKN